MSYPSQPEPRSIVRVDDGDGLVPISPSSTLRFVAPGSITDGRFGLFECRLTPKASGAVPHYHTTFSESFFVLSGRPSMLANGEWATYGPGDYVHVPERGVHGFRNEGDEPASFLILFAPGIARERYFEELAEIAASGRRPTPEQFADLLARHDQVNLPGYLSK